MVSFMNRKSLYWRVPNESPHLIKNLKLIHILDFCLLGLKLRVDIFDTDILFAIVCSIELYGNYEKENLEDVDDLRQMIEEIERNGEIELFYE